VRALPLVVVMCRQRFLRRRATSTVCTRNTLFREECGPHTNVLQANLWRRNVDVRETD